MHVLGYEETLIVLVNFRVQKKKFYCHNVAMTPSSSDFYNI